MSECIKKKLKEINYLFFNLLVKFYLVFNLIKYTLPATINLQNFFFVGYTKFAVNAKEKDEKNLGSPFSSNPHGSIFSCLA